LRLKENNIKPNDIMILVRKGSDIRKISETFEDYILENPNLDEETKFYFKLVSAEAFQFSSSSAICLIIDALRVLSEHNPLACANLAYTYQEQTKPNFSQDVTSFFTSYIQNKSEQTLHFKEFLPDRFCEEYETYQKIQRPLYELTEKIIDIFGLFEQKNQHNFLYDFLDRVNVFVSQNGSNITEFLDYWTDELQNKTIVFNAQGVQILTIHKAKGLEHHTVIVPFCEWEMDIPTRRRGGLGQLVWHESSKSENMFERMPLVPLNYGKELKNSHFTTDFENETLKLWIDNLNLLYVALTRPKCNLLVLANAWKTEPKNLLVSQLLRSSIHKQLTDDVFQEGDFIPSVEKHEEFDGNIFEVSLKNVEIPFSIVNNEPVFNISNVTQQWYNQDASDVEHVTPQLTKGLLYHRILAEIRYSEDIENTIEQLVFSGFISTQEKTMIANHIRELLNNPLTQEWFSKKYRVFNESKIVNRTIDGLLKQHRPDRVMQDEHGNLILVDFKTGKKYPEHHKQINDYSVLLEKMFANVENLKITGFLWYLDINEIEPVKLNFVA